MVESPTFKGKKFVGKIAFMKLSKQRSITCSGCSEPVHKLHTEAATHFLKITAFLLKSKGTAKYKPCVLSRTYKTLSSLSDTGLLIHSLNTLIPIDQK